MKRIIKFRQYLSKSKWHYLELRHGHCEGVAEASLDKYPISQFTGLLDKNGKEIYEGDIIRYNYHLGDSNSFDFRAEVIYRICERDCGDLSYRNVGFMLRAKDRGKFWYTDIQDLEDVEVIGNTFEHSELLKESK